MTHHVGFASHANPTTKIRRNTLAERPLRPESDNADYAAYVASSPSVLASSDTHRQLRPLHHVGCGGRLTTQGDHAIVCLKCRRAITEHMEIVHPSLPPERHEPRARLYRDHL